MRRNLSAAVLLLLCGPSDAYITSLNTKKVETVPRSRNHVASSAGAALSTMVGLSLGVDAAMADTTPAALPQEQVAFINSAPTKLALESSPISLRRDVTAWSSGSSIVTAAATANLANMPTSGVTITDINYDGKVPTTEADEYVVITNKSKDAINMSKYFIYVATTGTQGATFTFPNGSTLKPNQAVRVYTNEIHKETGGYSFASGKAIWNNKGGLAVLKDAQGKKIMEFKYKPQT